MENMNNNPVAEEAVVEAPVVEAPVVEAPVVEEAPAAPVIEEAPAEAPAPEQEVVNVPEPEVAPEQVQHLGAVSNGVMGTTSVSKPEPRSYERPKPQDSEEKVAIHSTKNVAWQGVGKVSRGYNIVTKDIADQWLTRPHIRIATPEEIKKAFG
jgi:hypothetical protein